MRVVYTIIMMSFCAATAAQTCLEDIFLASGVGSRFELPQPPVGSTVSDSLDMGITCIDWSTQPFGAYEFWYIDSTECCADTADKFWYNMDIGSFDAIMDTILCMDSATILLSDLLVNFTEGGDAVYTFGSTAIGFIDNSGYLTDIYDPTDPIGTYNFTFTTTPTPPTGYVLDPNCIEFDSLFTIEIEQCDCDPNPLTCRWRNLNPTEAWNEDVCEIDVCAADGRSLNIDVNPNQDAIGCIITSPSGIQYNPTVNSTLLLTDAQKEEGQWVYNCTDRNGCPVTKVFNMTVEVTDCDCLSRLDPIDLCNYEIVMTGTGCDNYEVQIWGSSNFFCFDNVGSYLPGTYQNGDVFTDPGTGGFLWVSHLIATNPKCPSPIINTDQSENCATLSNNCPDPQCSCSAFLIDNGNCTATASWSGNCSTYDTFLLEFSSTSCNGPWTTIGSVFNGQTVNTTSDGFYRLIVQDNAGTSNCPDRSDCNIVTGCAPDPCSCSNAVPSLNVNNCIADWNDFYCDWSVTLQYNDPVTGWGFLASSPTVTLNVNGEYRLAISKSGCSTIFTTPVDVTGCSPIDCSATPVITVDDVNCTVSWSVSGTGVSNYNSFIVDVDGVQFSTAMSGSNVPISLDGVYTFTIDGQNCTPLSDNDTATGCEAGDPCIPCMVDIVATGPCQLTASVTGCANHQVGLYLKTNGCGTTSSTFIQTMGSGDTYNVTQDGDYQIIAVDAAGGTVCQEQQGSCLTFSGCIPDPCDGCDNPVLTLVSECDYTHTICTNGWIATFYLAGTNTVVDSNNDGVFNGLHNTSYDLRWEKAGCTTIEENFTTNCPDPPDCTGCVDPDLTVDAATCIVDYEECAGWIVRVDGVIATGGFFVGTPGQTYTVTWEKTGCPTVSKDIPVPLSSVDVILGAPVLTNMGCTINEEFSLETVIPVTVNCGCCLDATFSGTVTLTDGTTNITEQVSFDCGTTSITVTEDISCGVATWTSSITGITANNNTGCPLNLMGDGVSSNPIVIDQSSVDACCCAGCDNPTALVTDDCVIFPMVCDGWQASINGTNVGAGGFQGQPSTTYTVIWSKPGCENRTFTLTTPDQSKNIMTGTPSLFPDCGITGSGISISLSMSGNIVNCTCCDVETSAGIDVFIDGILITTTSYKIDCDGNTTGGGINFNCGLYPAGTTFRVVTRDLTFGNVCDNTIITGGGVSSNTYILSQSHIDQCCGVGNAQSISAPINAPVKKDKPWALLSIILIMIILLYPYNK